MCQLGYPMLDKPDSEQLEEFILNKGFDNPELLNKINRAWGYICHQEMDELGKRNYIVKEAHTHWVKEIVKEVLLPFPPEPSMSLKPSELVFVPTYEVGKLKEVIKVLKNDNFDLRSDIGKHTLEKEILKFNLN